MSRMAGQVRNAWSLLPVLYESAAVWEVIGIQCNPESWSVQCIV